MPLPFPGMDPYLEEPGRWPDVHHELISISRETLSGLLRPKYLARLEERIYLSDEDEPVRTPVIPDVRISAQNLWEGVPFEPDRGASISVAEPIEVVTVTGLEIHEARIEIIDRESRTVVSVIEILSPSNKIPGSRGLISFESKRQEILDTSIHWIEIDLLRKGQRVRTNKQLPACEYLAYVSRVDQRPRASAWPIRLSQRLPVIPIPLKPEDPDATLDLQAVLNTAYDRAGYDLDTDYKRDPVPPLPPEWAEWSDALLRSKGLRPD